jgi:carbon storage regulator
MLIMRRRQGEAILIGADVELRILEIDRSRVKFGITAPPEVRVQAREIELVRDENRAAAQCSGAPGVVARLLHECGAVKISEKPEPVSDTKG